MRQVRKSIKALPNIAQARPCGLRHIHRQHGSLGLGYDGACRSSHKSAPRVARDTAVPTRQNFCVKASLRPPGTGLCSFSRAVSPLWKAPGSHRHGVNPGSMEKAPGTPQATPRRRGRQTKRTTSDFPPKHQAIGHHLESLGDQVIPCGCPGEGCRCEDGTSILGPRTRQRGMNGRPWAPARCPRALGPERAALTSRAVSVLQASVCPARTACSVSGWPGSGSQQL